MKSAGDVGKISGRDVSNILTGSRYTGNASSRESTPRSGSCDPKDANYSKVGQSLLSVQCTLHMMSVLFLLRSSYFLDRSGEDAASASSGKRIAIERSAAKSDDHSRKRRVRLGEEVRTK